MRGRDRIPSECFNSLFIYVAFWRRYLWSRWWVMLAQLHYSDDEAGAGMIYSDRTLTRYMMDEREWICDSSSVVCGLLLFKWCSAFGVAPLYTFAWLMGKHQPFGASNESCFGGQDWFPGEQVKTELQLFCGMLGMNRWKEDMIPLFSVLAERRETFTLFHLWGGSQKPVVLQKHRSALSSQFGVNCN